VLVPEGEFMMGSIEGKSAEKPVHRVELSAFYMDKYEVTNKLF
jgi:formylglycine-generating enzyme required for sulfatase activity